ncbi:hypothetical protein AVEN_248003-1 [Araneus ventricosus]|uniref:Uncharacterized protein n=1 Tax=Araneus ventricosus TaxID=182803 RepID=A0A4Y2JBK9_ARAVE|nr:hypothetical protein AVEN_248003-1 [Araneus ventricosus]
MECLFLDSCHGLKTQDHSTRENFRKVYPDPHLSRSSQRGYPVRTHASTDQRLRFMGETLDLLAINLMDTSPDLERDLQYTAAP